MTEKAVFTSVSRRRHAELQKIAEGYVARGKWSQLVSEIAAVSPQGKARDAVVALLDLEAVGGTDSDLFTEFSSLEGDTLDDVRFSATQHAIELLKEQIADRHTYFIDVEQMAMTPFAILAQDVIEARKHELERLDSRPSRIDVLGTYYGYTILLTDGAKQQEGSTGYRGYRYWRRRTWLDEEINENAAEAIKRLTGEFAEEVDMDRTYQTIGNNPVFKKRCSPDTAKILADAVRLSLYKVPGNRAKAARALGRTGDSRALAFLHNRYAREQNRGALTAIAEALGRIGHESSTEPLKEYVMSSRRRQTKDVMAAVNSLGGIDAYEAQEALLGLLKEGSNAVKAKSIEALGRLESPDLVNILKPLLNHRSRPVLRATVKSLIADGGQGVGIVRENIGGILGKLGNDRVSYPVLRELFSLSGMGRRQDVQVYFAKRISRLTKEVKRWNTANNRYYGYWYQRRERRARRELEQVLRMAGEYTQSPFTSELLDSLDGIKNSFSEGLATLQIINRTRLAEALYQR